MFARVLRKYPCCLFWFSGFAVTSHACLTPEYLSIFNACSTRNAEPAGRVYFPLPDLSRKIERDSACRVPVFHFCPLVFSVYTISKENESSDGEGNDCPTESVVKTILEDLGARGVEVNAF